MKAPELIIDKEFRDLLPKLTDVELAHLERRLIHEGCRTRAKGLRELKRKRQLMGVPPEMALLEWKDAA